MSRRRAESVRAPAEPADAARAPRRHPRRRRFGPLVMVVVGGLAMGAGIAAGAVVTGQAVAIGDPAWGEVTAGDVDQEPPALVEETLTPEPSPLSTAPPADPEALADTMILADGLTLAERRAGVLSDAVPSSATGTLVVVPGAEAAPHPERTVRTVRVEFEEGLDVDGEAFADFVMETLNDPRGWGGDASMSFARTDGTAQIRVVLASPAKVDAMCAPLNTRGIYSCGRYGHAAINHTRWVQATDEFSDLTQYRQYVVNHEVGHLLGRQHTSCPASGQLAPIMQQQTIAVAPCLPNAWPFPAPA